MNDFPEEIDREEGDVEFPPYAEDRYGTWLFICPACHQQWTREVSPSDYTTPRELCVFCKQVEIKAGF